VVDPQPVKRHKRFDQAVIKALEDIAQGTPAEVLLQASMSLGPAQVKDVIARSHLDSNLAQTALQELVDSSQVIVLEDMIISTPQWDSLKLSVLTTLNNYHLDNPLKRGIPREELKSRLKLSVHLFTLVIGALVNQNLVVESPPSSGPNRTGVVPFLALSTHKVYFSPSQQVKVEGLLSKFSMAPYSPPSVKDCQAEVGEDVFSALLESSDLIAVSTDVVFRKIDYDFMVEQVRQAVRQKGEVTLAEVRDLFQTSRKYIQAFLEHLDAMGITIRSGEARRLR
jgi:selenocysteine-specific elongation factor